MPGPAPVNNEFDWWLLIVGLVAGAGLVWLMLSTGREPSEETRSEAERAEAAWIAGRLNRDGRLNGDGDRIDDETARRILELHHDWETGGGEIDWDAEPADLVTGRDGAGRGNAEAPPTGARTEGAD